MSFSQNRESDEDTHAWPMCDKCGEPSDSLEPVDVERWCFECIRADVRAMLDEHARDEEMRSLRGYYSSELDRI
jgi:hypothetical protein